MRWMLLALGLVIGMTGGAGAVLYLVEKNKSADAGGILMSQKVFLDNETYLIVYGTVAGLEHASTELNHARRSSYCLSMIFSENRFPLFRIML